ncbi:Hypothetical protein A7982_11503 [Minicystis rosea]|nr:Hypothetical protein A7982_11503 [Minicystis rosea]
MHASPAVHSIFICDNVARRTQRNRDERDTRHDRDVALAHRDTDDR